MLRYPNKTNKALPNSVLAFIYYLKSNPMQNLHSLRLARLKKGYSQKNVADELGMSQPNYSNIESGKRDEVPDELLQRIGSIVGLEPPNDPPPAEAAPLDGNLLHQVIHHLDALKACFLKMASSDTKRGGGR